MAKDKKRVVIQESKAVINTRPIQEYLTSGEAINMQLQGQAPRQEVVVFDDLERLVISDHNGLTSIGSNTHAEIDDHIDDTTNPHELTPEQVGAARTDHSHSTNDLTDYPDVFPPVPHGHDDMYYNRGEHVDTSVGNTDAGKAVKLNGAGQIDISMIDASAFQPIGAFDPSDGTEYPDITGTAPGAFWLVDDLSNPTGVTPEPFYTFTGGSLSGQWVSSTDMMLWTATGWFIRRGKDYTGYYALDGSFPLTAPLSGGAQQLKNIADGLDQYDAATIRQLGILDNSKAEAFHSHPISHVTDLREQLAETVKSEQQAGVGGLVSNFLIMSKDEYASIIPEPGVVYGLKA